MVEYTTDGPGIATFQFKTNNVDISHSEIVRTVRGDISKYIDTAGTYTFTWDAKRDYPEQLVSNLTVEVTLWATNNPPTYCAVNLVGTPYQVRWYGKENEVPFGVTDSWWKKEWLLMRQIPSTQGEFVTLGSPGTEPGRNANRELQRNVYITKPFYMGVYQVTQLQWEMITGTKTSSYFNNPNVYEERPVEATYLEIRGMTGDNPAVNWPATTNYVSPNSFMGKLRSKTGGIIKFDLPTDAQWEYACRAGTTGAWNNGTTIASDLDVSDANLDLLGRYKRNGGWADNGSGGLIAPPKNCTDENGTAKVGSYLPNAWGLYDMHGNVYEWCLDWAVDTGTVTPPASMVGPDPVGPTSNSQGYRVRRGGDWGNPPVASRAATRSVYSTTVATDTGFRVVAPAEVFIAP